VVNIADVANFVAFAGGRQPVVKLASLFRDPVAAWLVANILDVGAPYTAFEVLAYDPALNGLAQSPLQAGYPKAAHFPLTGVSVERTDWTASAMLMAFKCVTVRGVAPAPAL
jgi:hypothetical protein